MVCQETFVAPDLVEVIGMGTEELAREIDEAEILALVAEPGFGISHLM